MILAILSVFSLKTNLCHEIVVIIQCSHLEVTLSLIFNKGIKKLFLKVVISSHIPSFSLSHANFAMLSGLFSAVLLVQLLISKSVESVEHPLSMRVL